ncbi:S1 family peptidase [Streptomyces sp. NPDC005500]|uniref:S1 family peptidase n=1 Tax=Streptomyces sp. NPDC005500 TaxID=3155007 RepID=UPI0033AA708A
MANDNAPSRPSPPPTDISAPEKPAKEAPPVSTEELPAGFASWESLFDEQIRLNDIADRIVKAGLEGYAGMVVDPTNHDVRLYWKGTLPNKVAAAVEEGRKLAPVKVLSAPYTDAELRAEAQRWLDSGRATDAYPKEDGSGVVVGVSTAASGGPPVLPGGSRATFTVKYGQEKFVPAVGEPAGTEKITTPAASPPWWRWNDTSPYWGGAMYEVVGGPTCTTGFSVIDSEGDPGMLTAAHCGQVNQQVHTLADSSYNYGQFYGTWAYQDVALIWVYKNVSGHVYVGPYYSDWSRAIAGASSNYTGNYVCPSGAKSGEHCAVKVYYVSPSDVTVRASRVKSGECAISKGDSGGPVISQNSGPAWGMGIISAGSGTVTCSENGVKGYHDMVYKGLKFTLGAFGATLKTS